MAKTTCYFIAEAIQKAVGEIIKHDDAIRDSLTELVGNSVRVEITDVGISLTGTVHEQGVQVAPSLEDQADVLIRGSMTSLALMSMRKVDNPFEIDKVEIVGDLAVAQKLFGIYQNMNIDYEEALAKRIGDIPARNVCNMFRWVKLKAQSLQVGSSVGEYMKSQAKLVPDRERVEQYKDDVDTLCADVERLGIRIERLTEAAPK